MKADNVNNLAMVLLAEGDYDSALKKLREAYVIFSDVGYKRGLANALHNMGLVLKDKGDLVMAMEFARQTVTLAEEIQDRRLRRPPGCDWGISTSTTVISKVL